MTRYSLVFISGTVATALIFDFINGFHDAANSIATVVSTRVLKPYSAVLLAAFFNFIAFLVFGLDVASTIGKDVVHSDQVDPVVVLAALLAAIFWDLLTWFWALPTSSSHALIGGLIGAASMKLGWQGVNLNSLAKIALSIFFAPIIAGFLGFFFIKITSFFCSYSTPKKVDLLFRKLQLLSASLYSLGHGGNDAQKTMGIIALLLYSGGFSGDKFYVPFWVVLACHSAIALGTLLGGWKIVQTMGMKITRLKPYGGFCAENAGAATLFLATHLGIPVSTTQTITGAIMGVGSERKLSAVRWGVARRIVIAWFVTIPAVCMISSVLWLVIQFLFTELN